MSDVSFQEMLRIARRLQKTYYDNTTDLNQRLISGCMTNLSQAQALKWKVPEHEVKGQRERLLGLVDAFQYIMSLLSLEGDPEVISRVIQARRAMTVHLHETAYKIDNLVEVATDARFAVVDIDGVLFPFPDELERFSECFPSKDPSEIKELYRLSGLKANHPPLKGAKALLEYLVENYTVIILSAREVELYPEVYIDTVSWLEQYNLPHDLLLFKEEKRGGQILPEILSRTEIFLDDSRDQLHWAMEYQPRFLIKLGQEDGLISHSDLLVVEDTSEALDLIKSLNTPKCTPDK